MSLSLSIAVYFIMWWVTLFLTLPFGVRGQHEAGDMVEGSEPGAPVRPLMWWKLLWTTVISAILFAALYFAVPHITL